jgi:hypothetical protein
MIGKKDRTALIRLIAIEALSCEPFSIGARTLLDGGDSGDAAAGFGIDGDAYAQRGSGN